MGWNKGLCWGLVSVTKLLLTEGFWESPGQSEWVHAESWGVR